MMRLAYYFVCNQMFIHLGHVQHPTHVIYSLGHIRLYIATQCVSLGPRPIFCNRTKLGDLAFNWRRIGLESRLHSVYACILGMLHSSDSIYADRSEAALKTIETTQSWWVYGATGTTCADRPKTKLWDKKKTVLYVQARTDTRAGLRFHKLNSP